MKTAEEYLPEESDLAFEGGIELFLKRKVVSSIEQAQIEAYNQAIDDALEEIDDYMLEYDDFNDFSAGVSSIPNKNKESVRKLKK